MNRYKKLFSNSVVFSIGNLGSKMITFFMVPLYTRYLTTGQYGKSDVILTLVDLLTPILTLSVIDAVFRFALDKNTNKAEVLTNGLFISLLSIIIFLFLTPFLAHVEYGIYVCTLTYLSALESTLQQFARGIGKSLLYAITGIVMTIATVISNIILIVFWGWQLQGYLASMFIAQIVGIIFLVWRLKAWKYINIQSTNKELIKRMLIYSIPLIPNMVSWWLSNSANKVFISLLIGSSANGIYAVANKIPSLISVFYSIFTQAWQISAVEEFNSKDAGNFFSTVLNATFGILFIGVSILTLLAKPLVIILSTPAYFLAWKIVPWLALAVLFASVSSFLGTIYTASMKTVTLFTTTVIGAITNIICNLILIPFIGVVGAGIGAFLSFLIVTILRVRDSRKFITLRINWKLIIPSSVAIIIQIAGLYLLNGYNGYIVALVCLGATILINSKAFLNTLNKIKK
ncbi:lipopolysaccharide biosynthesis protein [Pediococcus acidilactici]|uniref:lipopolysaccharide biosynthesis protein n=1 Tax=Pediococcus acidilactici TaxID=1254 RepID=UPI0013131D20|nr:oligosaccharide flippase family protein [Pediococcus acidilactici]KAF0339480.1 oligosaccharide flippase family protein [Pediococcus acidilactici]KAF0351424.1 oligosaccharide flippase family protein [Pediococcus acidilactici]KAF0355166.1 oligosaccharide flippase family protein [Pediococcus acidilactici]KAF0358843.1 oligosaccharide flippase family protein [Pediococcus acidilactici]KAF0374602.1 oligosaccharide flippase family protein [Pediococcus acidilactici]